MLNLESKFDRYPLRYPLMFGTTLCASGRDTSDQCLQLSLPEWLIARTDSRRGFAATVFSHCIDTGSQLLASISGSHGRLPDAKEGNGVEIGMTFVCSPAGVSDYALAGV